MCDLARRPQQVPIACAGAFRCVWRTLATWREEGWRERETTWAKGPRLLRRGWGLMGVAPRRPPRPPPTGGERRDMIYKALNEADETLLRAPCTHCTTCAPYTMSYACKACMGVLGAQPCGLRCSGAPRQIGLGRTPAGPHVCFAARAPCPHETYEAYRVCTPFSDMPCELVLQHLSWDACSRTSHMLAPSLTGLHGWHQSPGLPHAATAGCPKHHRGHGLGERTQRCSCMNAFHLYTCVVAERSLSRM